MNLEDESCAHRGTTSVYRYVTISTSSGTANCVYPISITGEPVALSLIILVPYEAPSLFSLRTLSLLLSYQSSLSHSILSYSSLHRYYYFQLLIALIIIRKLIIVKYSWLLLVTSFIVSSVAY